jgi:cytochrome c-type biogenesis protein CcmH
MIIAFAIALTLLALAALLAPLWRKQSEQPARADFDAKVFRDQLAEIDRDIERGILTKDQGIAVRIEVQRRLLAAIDREAEAQPTQKFSRWITILPLLLLLPVGAGALYAYLGRPLPDLPFASRQSDPDFQMAALADRLSKRLQAEPSADGYVTLGATYVHLHRYEEAVGAYRHAIRLGAVDGDLLASMGEAMVMTDDGAVGPEARQVFQHALMLNRIDPRARFYLGLSDAQVGQYAEAIAIWKDLEKDSAADAPWLPMLREHISEFAKMAGLDANSIAPMPPAANVPTPPAANVPISPAGKSAMPDNSAAAAVMAQTPEEQAKTIRSMVDGLAARLQQNPNDKEGWQRLARAYQVLGEAEKAKSAEARASALP